MSPREITGAVADTLVARFLARLPYELTTAQRRALAVIVADMAGPSPCIASCRVTWDPARPSSGWLLLAAVQSGHQGALMVPTEVLAEQHFSAVRALLASISAIDVRYKTGRPS